MLKCYATTSKSQPAANWLFSLNIGPNFHNMNGAGTPSANATKPNTLFPHPKSSALYMAGANSGNPNPAKLRRTVAAAIALAAYRVYESTRYVWMHWNPMMTPAQKMAAPMFGMIQWTWACALQPYQNRPMGTSSEAGTIRGVRNSGLPTPALRFFRRR